MIQLSEVSLARGPRPLLRDANLRIHAGEHVALIGPNGCGKSSLFALLRGLLHADNGEVSVPRDWRIAAMEQEVAASDRSVLDFVLDGDTEYRALEASLGHASGETLGELHARFAAIDGYSAPARAHELLDGLGFVLAERERAVREFSGGWRLRLALARTLMCPSDLLLLDEPTNHLDLDALLWLEGWLSRYQGTLLLISHDREFLDAVSNRILAIENTMLASYKGNYSAYERQHAEQLSSQQSAFQKQQQRIAQIENFVRRFRAKATKARQAQSRLKELERMTLIAPAHVDSAFELRLPCHDRVSIPLMNFSHAALGHGGRVILTEVNIGIMPGERIGLLGVNGAGKSTLIKAIAGELAPLSGERHRGEHLRVGYFAQHQLEALDPAATPQLHLQRLDTAASEQSIRDFLGGYGIHGDQALARAGNFSGGEQARLALAIIAWQRPNLLLLDEPTNHLDLEMRHALTVALQEYPGAVVIVSHDRHLLRNTVDEFYLVADGNVREFDGDLEDYRKLLPASAQRREPASSQSDNAPRIDRREERRTAAAWRDAVRPFRERVAALERDMATLQSTLERLRQQLAAPDLYEAARSAEAQSLLREQARAQADLARLEEAWLEASEALERCESMPR